MWNPAIFLTLKEKAIRHGVPYPSAPAPQKQETNTTMVVFVAQMRSSSNLYFEKELHENTQRRMPKRNNPEYQHVNLKSAPNMEHICITPTSVN